MKQIHYFTAICFLLLFSQCATIIPLDKNFYSDKKVAVIIRLADVKFSKGGQQDLLVDLATQGKPYKDLLSSINKDIDPTKKLQDMLAQIFTTKNKSYTFINEDIFKAPYSTFERPDRKKKYYYIDVRAIKAKYNVDELMVIKIDQYFMVRYYGVVPIDRWSQVFLNACIIDLNDNSILYNDLANRADMIKGDWDTPPNYDNVKKTFALTQDKAITYIKYRIQ